MNAFPQPHSKKTAINYLCATMACSLLAAWPGTAAAQTSVSDKGTESAGVVQPPALPQANAAFFRDSKLDLYLRNYAEIINIDPATRRHAWVQSARAVYESGYTEGMLQMGLDLSLYGAVKLDGGQGASTLTHLNRDGSGQDQLSWVYPGAYAIKLKLDKFVLKHGLQSVSNPYLRPYDIRSLPPSFHGTSINGNINPGLQVEAGSFTSVNARARTYLQPLSTTYGHVNFDRLSYAGLNWDYSANGKLSAYASQASEVWNQYFMALAHSINTDARIKWTGKANLYVTRNQGQSLQADINNQAYSLAVTAERAGSGLTMSYQQIAGNQFFDFTRETSGIYLANSYGSDYNAPHEKSLQLRYNFNGNAAGIKGLQLIAWGIVGWGVSAAAEANKNLASSSPLHGLYWKAGQSISGGHHEFGINPSYEFQDGPMKGSKISIVMLAHSGSARYPDGNFQLLRVMTNVPINIL